MNNSTLLAIKVERRIVAAAVFVGLQLDYTQVRQLANSESKAESSALAFVHWLVEMFGVRSVAIETQESGSTARRTTLTHAISASMRDEGIPVWESTKDEIFHAFAVPPLESRRDLWQIVSSFWPILENDKVAGAVMDAAALGIYMQVQRKLQS